MVDGRQAAVLIDVPLVRQDGLLPVAFREIEGFGLRQLDEEALALVDVEVLARTLLERKAAVAQLRFKLGVRLDVCWRVKGA